MGWAAPWRTALLRGLPALALGLGETAAMAQRPLPPQLLPIEARWCLANGSCLALEIADTPSEQAMGLQLRPPLPPLRGMWFPYAVPTPARFWMHRTPEPLDMLFVAGGQVIAIEAAAQPCPRLPCRSYGPAVPVEGVIELAAGQAAAQGIRLGTPVRIERFSGSAPAAPAPD